MFKISLALRLMIGKVRFPLKVPVLSPNIIRVQTSKLVLHSSEPISIVVDGEPVSELLQTREARFDIAARCNFLVPG